MRRKMQDDGEGREERAIVAQAKRRLVGDDGWGWRRKMGSARLTLLEVGAGRVSSWRSECSVWCRCAGASGQAGSHWAAATGPPDTLVYQGLVWSGLLSTMDWDWDWGRPTWQTGYRRLAPEFSNSGFFLAIFKAQTIRRNLLIKSTKAQT